MSLLLSHGWLPVSFKVDFKISLITFKALHGLAPSFIAGLLLSLRARAQPLAGLCWLLLGPR